MKVCERSYCSFHKWYPLFKKHTFYSVIEKVPLEVLAYLNKDGVVLPVEVISIDSSCQLKVNSVENSSNAGDCAEVSLESTENEPNEIENGVAENSLEQPSFPEFSKKLLAAINDVGGHAFIKSNWSAPMDASWIIPNKDLNCSTVEEIYLLLNSSSKLLQDFQLLKEKDECFLVIKKWQDIHPSTEFRCFVYNKSLIGISQRDCSDFHAYIPEFEMNVIQDISEFFNQVIKNTFPLQKYVFDIVRMPSGKIILVDFGVFDKKYSKSYLFTWNDLLALGNIDRQLDQPEFRYIASANGVQPTDRFTGFGVPYDLTNAVIGQQVVDSLIGLIEREINLQEE